MKDPERWPDELLKEPNKETEEEAKLTKEVFATAVETKDELDEILEKNSFWKTVRVTARIRRFLSNCKLNHATSNSVSSLYSGEYVATTASFFTILQRSLSLSLDLLGITPGNNEDLLNFTESTSLKVHESGDASQCLILSDSYNRDRPASMILIS